MRTWRFCCFASESGAFQPYLRGRPYLSFLSSPDRCTPPTCSANLNSHIDHFDTIQNENLSHVNDIALWASYYERSTILTNQIRFPAQSFSSPPYSTATASCKHRNAKRHTQTLEATHSAPTGGRLSTCFTVLRRSYATITKAWPGEPASCELTDCAFPQAPSLLHLVLICGPDLVLPLVVLKQWH